MINWDEFEHIHVIKKLKHIVHAWWNADIVFTDDRGHIRGPGSDRNKLNNPGVKFLLEKDVVLEQLSDFVLKGIDDLRQTGNRYFIRKWDIAGFDVAAFPILIEK